MCDTATQRKQKDREERQRKTERGGGGGDIEVSTLSVPRCLSCIQSGYTDRLETPMI